MEDAHTGTNQIDRYMRVPLVIHSLAEFRHIFFEAFELAAIKTIVEIGAEEGICTSELIEWATKNQATICSIDPRPSNYLSDLPNQHEVFKLVVGKSLDVLPTL